MGVNVDHNGVSTGKMISQEEDAGANAALEEQEGDELDDALNAALEEEEGDELDDALNAAFEEVEADDLDDALNAALEGVPSTNALWFSLPDEIWVAAFSHLYVTDLSAAMQAGVQFQRCSSRDLLWRVHIQTRWTPAGLQQLNGMTCWSHYKHLDAVDWSHLMMEQPSPERDLFIEMHLARRAIRPNPLFKVARMPRVRVNLEETQYDVDIDDDTYEDEPQDADGEDFDKGVRGRQFEFGYNCSEEQLEGFENGTAL